jgi:hypothetical protein
MLKKLANEHYVLTYVQISALNYEGHVNIDINEDERPWLVLSTHRGDSDNPADAVLPLSGPAAIATIQQLGLAAINASEGEREDRVVEHLDNFLIALGRRRRRSS